MTKFTTRKTVRGLMGATGACLLTLAPGMPAGAEPVAQSVNETINVPGQTPSGFVSVDGQTVGIPGARDVSINIQATAAVGDLATLGTSGGTNCARLDRSLQLTLNANAVGAVTVNYTTVDPVTDVGTLQSESIPLEAEQSGATPVIGLCLR